MYLKYNFFDEVFELNWFKGQCYGIKYYCDFNFIIIEIIYCKD